ncbi:MAG: hypothetical protein ABIQ30_10130 [Devosia sp.]
MTKAKATTPNYIPTADEKKLMDEWLARPSPRTPRLSVTVDDNGALSTSTKHPEPALGELLMMRALGLNSSGELVMFKRNMIGMCRVSDPPDAKAIEREVNNIIDVVAAHNPQGITEAMLCLQMAAVHIALSRAMQTVMSTDYAEARAAASDTVNKLSRTFTMQMDALKRYRSKGREQRVVVEHKHYNYVAPGAQAVFVDSDQSATGGGVEQKTGSQSHGRAPAQIASSGERPTKLVDLALTDKAAA